MNILFWNLKRNSNIEEIISNLIVDNDVDIFLCSEFHSVDFDNLITMLKNEYVVLADTDTCEKIKVIFKKGTLISMLRAQHRSLTMKLTVHEQDILLVGVHLSPNPTSTSDVRKYEIRDIMTDIDSDEQFVFGENKHRSMVIGDMNANPFDSEMVNKDSFNAVLFKDIIEQSDTVVFEKEEFERFYNPALDYINENNKNYGSFYYSSGIGCLYWYCYDQVLLRKDLINHFVSMDYIKEIGEAKLINRIAPNKSISDHLPLLVKMDI